MKKRFGLTEIMCFYFDTLVDPKYQNRDTEEIYNFFGVNEDLKPGEKERKKRKVHKYLKTKLPFLPALSGWETISPEDRPFWLLHQRDWYGSNFELDNNLTLI